MNDTSSCCCSSSSSLNDMNISICNDEPSAAAPVAGLPFFASSPPSNATAVPGHVPANITTTVSTASNSNVKNTISSFLSSCQCYDLVRPSGKVVVFDWRISVQLAFYALVEHDMHAAPLWDSTTFQFVGLFTVTDFIYVLRHYHQMNMDVSILSTRSIEDIVCDESICGLSSRRQRQHHGQQQQQRLGENDQKHKLQQTQQQHDHNHIGLDPIFIAAEHDTSLIQAVHLLRNHSLYYLPIFLSKDMRILSIICYTTILTHIVTHYRRNDDCLRSQSPTQSQEPITPVTKNTTNSTHLNQPIHRTAPFSETPYNLQIGTYHPNLITATLNQTLNDTFHLLQSHNISTIPVLNSHQQLVALYSMSDITFMASANDAHEALTNLGLTLEQLLSSSPLQNCCTSQASTTITNPTTPNRSPSKKQHNDIWTPDSLHICSINDSLQIVLEYFAEWKCNRVLVMDDGQSHQDTDECGECCHEGECSEGKIYERVVVGVVSAQDLVSYFVDNNV